MAVTEYVKLEVTDSLLIGLLVTDRERHIDMLARWLWAELPCSVTATSTPTDVRHRYDDGIPCPLIHLAINSGTAPKHNTIQFHWHDIFVYQKADKMQLHSEPLKNVAVYFWL